MAKRGTLNHPKNKRLARALKSFHGCTLGLLETLWHQAAQFHTNGVMSRLDVEDVLDAGGWIGPFTADQVITALTHKDHAWLDVLPDGNFYVHDWHEHCDDATHAKLYRAITPFGNGRKPLPRKVYGDEKAELEKQWVAAQAYWTSAGHPADALPCPSLPSLAMPSQAGAMPDTPPSVNDPFEKPPKPPIFVDPIGRYPKPIAEAARESHSHWYFWAHGGMANLHSESTGKDLNRLAAAEESQPGTIVNRIKGFVAKPPPGWPRDSPLFKVLKHLGYDAPVASSFTKPQPPKPIYKDYTAERLAQSMNSS